MLNLKVGGFRWIVTLIVFIGLFCNYMLRIHIDFAIIQMVGNGTKSLTNGTIIATSYKQYNWTPLEKSWVLGSYFYGYILLQVPGGRFVEKYGTKMVLGISMLGSVAVTFLLPILADLSPWAVVTARIIQGLLLSPTFPSLPPFTVKWSPITERSKFTAFIASGSGFGSALTFLLCGLIMDQFGWPMVFYITASISLVWCAFWFIFVSDTPETNRWISQTEVEYILEGREQLILKKELELEGKEEPSLFLIFYRMITSPSVWVVMACDFAFCWGLYAFLVMGPTFIEFISKGGKQLTYTENAILTMLPFLASVISSQLSGFVSDYLIKQRQWPRIKTQRVFTTLELLPPAVATIVMGFLTSDPLLCVMVITIGFTFGGCNSSGQIQNTMLQAPNRAGTMLGITNGFGNCAGAVIPVLCNWLTHGAGGLGLDPLTGWRIFFGSATVFYVIAWVLFFFFAVDKQQDFDTFMVNKSNRDKFSKPTLATSGTD